MINRRANSSGIEIYLLYTYFIIGYFLIGDNVTRFNGELSVNTKFVDRMKQRYAYLYARVKVLYHIEIRDCADKFRQTPVELDLAEFERIE